MYVGGCLPLQKNPGSALPKQACMEICHFLLMKKSTFKADSNYSLPFSLRNIFLKVPKVREHECKTLETNIAYTSAPILEENNEICLYIDKKIIVYNTFFTKPWKVISS